MHTCVGPAEREGVLEREVAVVVTIIGARRRRATLSAPRTINSQLLLLIVEVSDVYSSCTRPTNQSNDDYIYWTHVLVIISLFLPSLSRRRPSLLSPLLVRSRDSDPGSHSRTERRKSLVLRNKVEPEQTFQRNTGD